MTTTETATQPDAPTTSNLSRKQLIAELLTEWRWRWPAAFTTPVPLVAGFSGQMRKALNAEGRDFDRKMLGIAVKQWTMQSGYLHAVARGKTRLNLDGSAASPPDEAARKEAQDILDQRSARIAEKKRQRQKNNL